MHRTSFLVLGIFALVFSGCVVADNGGGGSSVSTGGESILDSTVTIANQSNFAIYQMFMSSTADPAWGPDQLGRDVLLPGETFTLSNIPCDSYDVRLVDEDGDECVLQDVDICVQDDVWVIDNASLAVCQIFS